jgi:hypothetical protein
MVDRQGSDPQLIQALPCLLVLGDVDHKVRLQGDNRLVINVQVPPNLLFFFGLGRVIAVAGHAYDLFTQTQIEQDLGDAGSEGDDSLGLRPLDGTTGRLSDGAIGTAKDK